MSKKPLGAIFAILLLAGCQTERHYSIVVPPPPPPPATGAHPAPVPARQKPAMPKYAGTAGPLTAANTGRYMDGLEHDLRLFLRGTPVARPGDTLTLTLPSDRLFEKTNLSEDGRDVLTELAAALRHYDHTVIQVNGYTDTRGSSESNLRISQKRADSVAAELRANGIAGSRITATGYGATHLKKATGQGVAEARNRRIEIRILPQLSG